MFLSEDPTRSCTVSLCPTAGHLIKLVCAQPFPAGRLPFSCVVRGCEGNSDVKERSSFSASVHCLSPGWMIVRTMVAEGWMVSGFDSLALLVASVCMYSLGFYPEEELCSHIYLFVCMEL